MSLAVKVTRSGRYRVSKSAGLILYPVFGALVYTIVTISVKDHTTHGSLGPAAGLTIALGIMLIGQVGALAVAITRSRDH